MNVNDIYYGFKLVSVKEIKEIDSILYEFYHEKSGANLVYLANDDTNKCFSIGFKTFPVESSGKVLKPIEKHLLVSSLAKYTKLAPLF